MHQFQTIDVVPAFLMEPHTPFGPRPKFDACVSIIRLPGLFIRDLSLHVTR